MRFNMEINDILKLIEAVSGAWSYQLCPGGERFQNLYEKGKGSNNRYGGPAVQTVIAPAAADARIFPAQRLPSRQVIWRLQFLRREQKCHAQSPSDPIR